MLHLSNQIISIHALLAESDANHLTGMTVTSPFLSTLSLRRATFSGDHGHINGDISIHALLAESDLKSPCTIIDPEIISIHALLAESDRSSRVPAVCHWYFYPRSPCGERPVTAYCEYLPMAFLSTLSLRRATQLVGGVACRVIISIHALLAESDLLIRCQGL